MSDEPTRARPQMPRIVAIIIVAAIAVASIAALFWPKLGADVAYTGPTEVGVIRRLVDSPSQAARIGDAAPDFEWNAPDGKTRRLSGLRGQVVVINFWATWCVPCKQELLDIQKLYDEKHGDGLEVLEINYQEGRADALGYFEARDLTMPLLLDSGSVFDQYKLRGLPDSFFIDRDGKLSSMNIGVLSQDRMRQRLADAGLP